MSVSNDCVGVSFFRMFCAAQLLLSAVFAFTASGDEKLFFGSDVHCSTGNLHTRLSSCGNAYDFGGLCGDHVEATNDNTNYGYVHDTLSHHCSSVILSQGNHDGSCYSNTTGAAALAGNDNYDVYVINWENFTTAKSALGSYLSAYNGGKVVFVMSHYPLHSTREASYTTAAQDIFDTLQKYGQKIDIVFLWGHNHHSGYDNGIDYVALPGETIWNGSTPNSYLIAGVKSQTLKFTYLNAGYVKDSNTSTVISLNDSLIAVNRCGNSSPATDTVKRKRPSVALLIDVSGSMSWDVNNNSGVDESIQRLTLVKHAAEAFINMFSDYGGYAGAGIACFPNHPQTGCAAQRVISVVPVSSGLASFVTAVNNLSASGSTPMLAGIDTASKLLDSASRKAIILLSDGYHNCPSQVSVGSSAYNTMINSLGNTAVYTIGFSCPGDVDGHFLDNLASSTSGTFSDVTDTNSNAFGFDPDNAYLWTADVAEANLNAVYANILTDVLGLDKIVDPLGTIGQAGSKSSDVSINSFDRKVTFLLSWHTASEKKLGLALTSSDGKKITVRDKGVVYHHGKTYKIFCVDKSYLSQEGKVSLSPWKMEVTGDGIGKGETEKYQYCVITQSDLCMKASLDKKTYSTGDIVTLSADLTLKDQPLLNADSVSVSVVAPSSGAGNWFAANKVTAEQLAKIPARQGQEILSDIQRKAIYLRNIAGIKFPGRKAPVKLVLYDNGTNGDAAANDGIYTNRFVNTDREGTYVFSFRAKGKAGEQNVFCREKTIHKYVTVKTSADFLNLSYALKGTTEKISQYVITIVPKDSFGNFMGPRLAQAIKLNPSRGSFSGNLTDNLDGSYSQTLELPHGVSYKNVKITVTIDGITVTKPLYQSSGSAAGMLSLIFFLIVIVFLILMWFLKKKVG